MHVRVLLAVVLTATLVVSGAAIAFAADNPDSLSWVGPDGETSIYTDGGSRWTYSDLTDQAAGIVKDEGGYLRFNDYDADRDWDVYAPDGADYSYEATGVVSVVDQDLFEGKGPHGGYDSSTNKCKVCHAVHRAEGAYFLLRSDTQADACSYCHIGGNRRARTEVYYSDPELGIFAGNGHTIGASSEIPDSSVAQELHTVTLTTADGTEDVLVRRYAERRNQMFRFSQGHGQSAPAASPTSPSHGGPRSLTRVGPLALSCMSCHQVHNALDLVWKPADTLSGDPTAGYKLLRLSPSGSVFDEALMEGRLAGQVGSGDIVKTPEENLNPNGVINTGEGYTIWTEWPQDGVHIPPRSPRNVSTAALSVWCADCHNLNIGYFREVGAEFGGKSHADRTHPVPFAGADSGPGQCYSCHRNDMVDLDTLGMATEYGTDNCDQCHLGPDAYAAMRVDNSFDFPHSGPPSEYKLLSGLSANLDANGVMETTMTVVTADNLDAVCMRCHTGIGTRH